MRLNGFFCAARAMLGTTYLLFPALPLRATAGGQDEQSARATARILGARHLAQALVTPALVPRQMIARMK
jgi:hypothetical protein